MTVSFEDATRALAQIASSTHEFEDACSQQMQDVKDELQGVDSALRSILAHQAQLKLPDGTYLYLKNHQSARTLNENRIAKAVDALTLHQLNTLLKEEESKTWSPTRLLCEALADNLDAECIVRSTAPTICKKAPLDSISSWRDAPATVVAHAKRFVELQTKLSSMRKHRSLGKKRAASVQAVAEPIVQKYLETKNLTRQAVRFGAEPPTPPSLALPALPDVPPGFTAAPVASTPEQAIIQQAVAEGPLNGQTVMFVSRTYTSRGKAPKLNSFIDALPECLTPLLEQDSYSNLLTKKTDILKAMLDLYSKQFQTDQGSVKKRLVVKTI